jgi:hypothetical protein
MSTYIGKGLLEMMPDKSNQEYPAQFSKMIVNIKQGESIEIICARISFALENTYKNHISRIEEIVSDSA